ncbi:MAG: hypothetical protein RIS36_1774 [Pseudomonadota bacterium]
MLMSVLRGERERFASLPEPARSLLVSFIAFGVAAPLLTLFTNAFLWRQSQDLVLVTLFNGAWMAGVALSFILNGYLLRAMQLSWLYAIGLVIQSVSCLLLFGLQSVGLVEMLTFGVISGLAAGIYWSNRNLLILQVTEGEGRNYFCGLESAIGTLLAVLSPFVLGLFLELGLSGNHTEVFERYRLLAFVTLAVQLVGAWYIVRSGFDDYSPRTILMRRASALWTRARIFMAVKGIAEGSGMFIPTLIILRLVGQEAAVGLTQSLSMLFTGVALYVVAARMKVANRGSVLGWGISAMVMGALTLSVSYSHVGALVYLILETLGVQLLWIAANPIIFDVINADQEDSSGQYPYIVDRELFLNLGRIVGVGAVVTLSALTGPDVTLRTAPLILAIGTSTLLFLVPRLRENG